MFECLDMRSRHRPTGRFGPDWRCKSLAAGFLVPILNGCTGRSMGGVTVPIARAWFLARLGQSGAIRQGGARHMGRMTGSGESSERMQVLTHCIREDVFQGSHRNEKSLRSSPMDLLSV